MRICVKPKDNYQYDKIPGKSYRDDSKLRKNGVVYLGSAINLEKGVFYNIDRGVFTYDDNTETYGTADPRCLGGLANGRKKSNT